jgi:hypothetical protein
MPVFEITTPDGKVFEVTAPEGATKDQALVMAKTEYYKQQRDSYVPRNPTANMSGPQKFFAGMGKSIYDTGRGIGNLVGMVSDEELSRAKELDDPLMDTGAGIAGNVAGHIGQVLAPGGLLHAVGKTANAPRLMNAGRELMAPTSFKTGAGVGAGYNFVQPGTMQERTASAAFGGALGGAGGYIGGKIGLPRQPYQGAMRTSVQATPEARISGGGYNYGHVTPDTGGLTSGQEAALSAGQKMGFKTTPGQASGSRAFQQLEAKLESQPMTSAPFNAIKDSNQTVLNRVAAKAIGETSDNLDTATLAKAHARIGEVYKDVADDAVRKIDEDQFLGALADLEDKFDGLLPGTILDNPLVKRFYLLAEKGEATGRQLQSLASKMGRSAYKNMTSAGGDRDMGLALYSVKDHVDSLLAVGLDETRGAAFKEARNQYRNLMLLTQRNGILNPGSGNVHGNALGGLLQQKDKAGYLYGKNQSDLYNAARFGQAFRPLFGDSGTATRSVVPSATDMALTMPTNILTEAYLKYPQLTGHTGNAIGRAAPLAGLLGGGMVGREMY